MRKYAQMWRISNDIWDLWHSTADYPQGLGDQFANVAKWAGRRSRDTGRMPTCCRWDSWGRRQDWGKARETLLSHDEQRTFMTLWCIFPSPLMVGGELPSADDWTSSLLTQSRSHRGGSALDRKPSGDQNR